MPKSVGEACEVGVGGRDELEDDVLDFSGEGLHEGVVWLGLI